MFLSIHDLVQFTAGQLRLAAMPHVDGAWVQVPRIVLDSRLVERGDLFWRVEPQDCDTQLAFLRGAIGIVTDGRQVEPWPGTFCLHVADAIASLERLIEALQSGQAAEIPERFLPQIAADEVEAGAIAGKISAAGEPAAEVSQESFQELPELKVLQLPARGGTATFPLTCGQLAARCRRRAA
jgi:hypothetical protein